jgi:hypothetical protein
MTEIENQTNPVALDYMKSGNFDLALSIFLNELEYDKTNLSLLVNIATCYYRQRDFLKYRLYTMMLLNVFESQNKIDSDQDLRLPLLTLIKLLEDLGEIGICFRLIKNYTYGDGNDRLDSNILTQKLRLSASFPDNIERADLSKFFDYFNIKNETAVFDLQRALLIADWALFGDSTASARLNNFLGKSANFDFESRHLVFDHLFEALKMKKAQFINPKILDGFIYLQASPFEQIIWDLYLIDIGQEPNTAVSLLRPDGLTPMDSLKIHYLYLKRENNSLKALEIRKKLMFQLNNLSQVSREIFLKNWLVQEEKIQIQIKSESVVIEGREYCLKKSPSIRTLFEELASKNFGSAEQLIQKIWQNEFDEDNLTRLRVLIHRGNAFLKKMTGLNRPISMSKHHVQLNTNVTIRKFSA